MGRWYQGKGNDEGLKQLAELYEGRSGFQSYVSYLRLRESGLRKQAFETLAIFIASIKQWDSKLQQKFVDELMHFEAANPSVYDLIPHPLQQEIVLPCLRKWCNDEPDGAIPHRWLGVLLRNYAEYKKALELDPTDQISLRWNCRK